MTPVTLFHSADAGAPQLTGAAGSLKTLLKACLVSGYGGKQPLGWTMPFEEDHKAVFKSTDPKSTQPCLLVDNPKPKFATLQPYQKMTAINKGEGFFGLGAVSTASLDKFGYFNSQSPKWWLAGHGAAFVFAVKLEGYEQSMLFYFGDVRGLGAHKTALYWSNADGREYAAGGNRLQSVTASSGGNPGVLSRSFGNVAAAQSRLISATDLANASNRPPYPDPITAGLVADAVHLSETSGSQILSVAALDGFLCVLNDLSRVAEGTQIQMDGDDDVWLKFSSTNAQHFLINASQWS